LESPNSGSARAATAARLSSQERRRERDSGAHGEDLRNPLRVRRYFPSPGKCASGEATGEARHDPALPGRGFREIRGRKRVYRQEVQEIAIDGGADCLHEVECE
jgi:hypothetical protein